MSINYFDDCPACRIDALDVACPICAAPRGEPCRNITGELAIRSHGYRVQVAAEVTP